MRRCTFSLQAAAISTMKVLKDLMKIGQLHVMPARKRGVGKKQLEVNEKKKYRWTQLRYLNIIAAHQENFILRG